MALWLLGVLILGSEADTISWEAHGRDDLREWRAVFLKGNEYMKIDLNFRNELECRLQHRARIE